GGEDAGWCGRHGQAHAAHTDALADRQPVERGLDPEALARGARVRLANSTDGLDDPGKHLRETQWGVGRRIRRNKRPRKLSLSCFERFAISSRPSQTPLQEAHFSRTMSSTLLF